MYEFGLLSDQKPHFTFRLLLSFNPINLVMLLMIYSLFCHGLQPLSMLSICSMYLAEIALLNLTLFGLCH